MNDRPRILGIAGSLRSASVNHLFLRAMALIKPTGVDFSLYHDLQLLPLFNPDNECKPGAEVLRWRAALTSADMILLASPEYAHGVTGVIKNALDWVVGSGELMDKYLAFPNLSMRATLAQSQLSDTLHILGCRQIASCSPQSTPENPLILPNYNEQQLLAHCRTGPCLHLLWVNIHNTLLAEADNENNKRAQSRHLW
ncbi:FMN reductase [Serratia sp. Leaf50]|nr:FMN reductase [Serratia sp. Leaf50]